MNRLSTAERAKIVPEEHRGEPGWGDMAAGLADHIWTCEEIAALLD
jgi:hypothetical protein